MFRLLQYKKDYRLRAVIELKLHQQRLTTIIHYYNRGYASDLTLKQNEFSFSWRCCSTQIYTETRETPRWFTWYNVRLACGKLGLKPGRD